MTATSMFSMTKAKSDVAQIKSKYSPPVKESVYLKSPKIS
jgi:hypothetical protein